MDENTPNLKKAGIVNVTFGRNVTIVEPANVYGCTLEDDVFVGPFVEIQCGVVIGARTRVQSHTFVCEGVTVGQDCFVAHGVRFTNDDFKGGTYIRNDPTQFLKTEVGDGVCIGSGVTILPVRIADGIVIGAGAVVTRDLLEKGIYAGNPARLIRPL
jgi:acetyltransferase-like isoleucine patch superfamily enzyme